MTPPPDQRLGQLVTRLRQGGLELTPQEIADALWLAQWVTPAAGPPGTGEVPSGNGDLPVLRPAEPSAAPGTSGRAPRDPAPRTARTAGGERAERSGPVALYAHGPRQPARTERAFGVRAPTAASLPGLLDLQRALRPLRGYRPLAAPPPGPLDECVTADRAARTGVVQPAYRPGGRRATSMQLLMDVSPSMAVWERTLEELRQTCAQLGVFRDVQVRYLHRSEDGAPVIATGATPGGARRPRPADQFRDPSGRCLTLVLSDCVGPLWREGTAQRLLHHWSQTAPLAVVQPLPPRLWPRTALPAEAGLLVRDPAAGGRLRFEPGDFPGYAPPPPRGALPVPVLLPHRDALGAWARLLSGPGRTTVRGAAGWVLPRHPAQPEPPGAPGAAPPPEDLLRAFRASATPGALRLAVHLAAVPLTLPVMQLVQRAMLPDTGPMELAEVLLSGLLWELPAPDGTATAGPAGHWYEFADGVRELLLQSLDQGAAVLVLKHCSDYVERHFGKGARNFPAMAVAQLSGAGAAGTAEDTEPGTGPAGPELFAEVPARVVRWYQPVTAREESDPADEAERLFALWESQPDPATLDAAQERARTAAAAYGHESPAGQRARLLLGRVLVIRSWNAHRDDPQTAHTALLEAEALLTDVHEQTAPGTDLHTRAGLKLADVCTTRWQREQDLGQLLTAERVLTALPADDPVRCLKLGLVLLSRAEATSYDRASAELAAHELRSAHRLFEADGAAPTLLGTVLLHLARAMRLSGAPAEEIHTVLDRAELPEDTRLPLLRLLERARVATDAHAWTDADQAYEAAVARTDSNSAERAGLLAQWGESVLGRPPGETGTASAESVLREAYVVVPGRDPARPRIQLLLARALLQRFAGHGFLPDLYESVHLLEQAARHAPDRSARAEAWLELGSARITLHERSATVPFPSAAAFSDAALKSAADAFGKAAEEAEPGTAVLARALHHKGRILERLGRRRAALDAYRAAAREWAACAARPGRISGAETRATREAVARLEGGRRS
ncbi:SAV_2336 N-terminal domain-related protein [Streptomyces gamaensis]|uniref:SAV_2336 N-terminal domain-related protein n=1 Tax=Streptomyces gamaensis TaxID=1763542 RepID=A0ABW0Z7Y7_9ACTN